MSGVASVFCRLWHVKHALLHVQEQAVRLVLRHVEAHGLQRRRRLFHRHYDLLVDLARAQGVEVLLQRAALAATAGAGGGCA